MNYTRNSFYCLGHFKNVYDDDDDDDDDKTSRLIGGNSLTFTL